MRGLRLDLRCVVASSQEQLTVGQINNIILMEESLATLDQIILTGGGLPSLQTTTPTVFGIILQRRKPMYIDLGSHAPHMPLTCHSHVTHMPLTFHSHATHMPLTCHSHATHIWVYGWCSSVLEYAWKRWTVSGGSY